MHANRVRAGTRSSRRAVQTLALSVAAISAFAIVGPSVALASENVDTISLVSFSMFTTHKEIQFDAVRFVENSADPVRVTATESEDHRTVTIRDVSRAAGGFTASAPCEKTEAATAVCPTADSEGHVVSLITVEGSFAGENEVTVNAPTLLSLVLTGRGNDTISVLSGQPDVFQSTAAQLFGEEGNDTLTGGSGLDLFYGEQGTDTIFAFNEPAKQDTVFCSPRGTPLAIAHVDSLDTINGECSRVIRGP